MTQARKLAARHYPRAIFHVARLSFRVAPWPISAKLLSIVIDSCLPIVITYFAALTTTQLGLAFAGDQAAGSRAISYIAITAALGFGATAWRSFDQYIQAMMRYKIQAKVSDMMYDHFLSLDFWQYDDKKTVDLYERAQKFSQFFAYVFDRLAGVLTQLITLVFSLVALAIFLPWLALFALMVVVPGLIIQLRLSRLQINHWNKTVDARRTVNYIEWNLFNPRSIAELRLNGLVRHLLDLRYRLRDKDERARLKFERDFIGKRLLAEALEAVAELGSLLWIALEIIAARQPLGQFVYVQQLMSRAMNSASEFVSQLGTIDEDLANLVDYQEFMSLTRPDHSGRRLKQTPLTIVFDNVSFRYPGAKRSVLTHVSFSIKRGQHVAIVGENGAGKTTLIKLLTGLYSPTKGSIRLDKINLADLATSSWHRQLSVLQQDFEQYIFANVQDNVYYGDVSKPLHRGRLSAALRKAEAELLVRKLPRGRLTLPSVWMEDDEGNRGTNLSGGQWQRLALARNFYRDAPIIILDEPTSAIDALAERRIFKRLFARSNDQTVITISHRLSTVEKANHIIVLKDGAIAEQGTHAELVKTNGEYWRIFKEQL